jgi:hypothetical protein
MKKKSSISSEISTSMEEKSKEDFISITEDNGEQKRKRSWIHRLNPLKRDEIPPIPECDAGLVPELQANWFSKLTWGWMAPLMMVHTIPMFYITESIERLPTAIAKGGSLAVRRGSPDPYTRRQTCSKLGETKTKRSDQIYSPCSPQRNIFLDLLDIWISQSILF